MDILRDLLLVLHLLGMGALFGGALVQLRDSERVVNSAMLYGIGTQVVTGLLLVGVLEGQDEPVNNPKTAVKLAVALVVAVLCWVNRRRDAVPAGIYYAILLLTVANVAIAALW